MWKITNERKDASPLIGFLPLFRSMTTEISPRLALDRDLEFLVEFSNRHVRMAAFVPDWELVGELTVRKLEQPEFIDWISGGLSAESRNLNGLGDKLRALDVGRTGSNVLAEHFRVAICALEDFLVYNQFVNAADFYHELLTKRLFLTLNGILRPADGWSPGAAYGLLTTPEKTVWIQEEQEELLNIMAAIQAKVGVGGKHSMTEAAAFSEQEFQRHADRYFWMQYEQEGAVKTPEDFRREVMHMGAAGIVALDELSRLKDRRKRLAAECKLAAEKIQMPPESQQLFAAARQLVYWKLHLREIKVRFYCSLEGLMNEAAARLGLDKLQVRHLTVNELTKSLASDFKPDASAIDRRIAYSVFHFTKGVVTVLTGDDARKAFGIVAPGTSDDFGSAVEGTCGQPGTAVGRVRQVLAVEEVGKFRTGEVLVAYMTDVGIVPAMRRAAAIVTDVGGVTCHAAIVAREFGIPCVIGTRIGTKALHDGYLVKVSADTGLVEILAKEPFGHDHQARTPDEPQWAAPVGGLRLIYPSNDLSSTPIRKLSDVGSRDISMVGGKAAALGELIGRGFRVPPGFVIPSSTFYEFVRGTGLASEIGRLLADVRDIESLTNKSQIVRDLICNTNIPSETADKILSAFDELQAPLVAVRSSAVLEDSAKASWAGQLDTFLNTTRADVLENVRRCWSSRFSARAMVYGLDTGGEVDALSTAVVVQEMVDSRIAGTAFSIHPVLTNTRAMLIESCVGLGELLVSGRETPTRYVVDRDSLTLLEQTTPQPQRVALRRATGGSGNELMTLKPDEMSANELTDVEIKELSQEVMKAEREFGFPVDVEWAFDREQLYFLQSRPITSLTPKQLCDPHGARPTMSGHRTIVLDATFRAGDSPLGQHDDPN